MSYITVLTAIQVDTLKFEVPTWTQVSLTQHLKSNFLEKYPFLQQKKKMRHTENDRTKHIYIFFKNKTKKNFVLIKTFEKSDLKQQKKYKNS